MSDPTPPPRIFTVEEARALLPELRAILDNLRAARRRLSDAQEEMAGRSHGGDRSNGHVSLNGDGDRFQQAVIRAQSDLGAAVRRIAELGCELKDPERGMVDFRTMREGRVVYLCWLQEEPTILYWHELDGGYRGRQPLNE